MLQVKYRENKISLRNYRIDMQRSKVKVNNLLTERSSAQKKIFDEKFQKLWFFIPIALTWKRPSYYEALKLRFV